MLSNNDVFHYNSLGIWILLVVQLVAISGSASFVQLIHVVLGANPDTFSSDSLKLKIEFASEDAVPTAIQKNLASRSTPLLEYEKHGTTTNGRFKRSPYVRKKALRRSSFGMLNHRSTNGGVEKRVIHSHAVRDLKAANDNNSSKLRGMAEGKTTIHKMRRSWSVIKEKEHESKHTNPDV